MTPAWSPSTQVGQAEGPGCPGRVGVEPAERALARGLRCPMGGTMNASSLVGPRIRLPEKPKARRGDGAGFGIHTPHPTESQAGLLQSRGASLSPEP